MVVEMEGLLVVQWVGGAEGLRPGFSFNGGCFYHSTHLDKLGISKKYLL